MNALKCALIAAVLLPAQAWLLYQRLVPLPVICFPCFVAAYAALANSFVLPQSPPLAPGGSLTPARNTVRFLFPFTCVLSLAAPALLIVLNPVLAPALAPHLFVVIWQLLLETASYVLANRISLFVRLAVPIALAAYRLSLVLVWYDAVADLEDAGVAQVLAVVNGVYWSFGLFCFLLLYCLPAAVNESSSRAKDAHLPSGTENGTRKEA